MDYKVIAACLSCFGLGIGTGFLISKKRHDAQLEREKESYRKALSNYISKRETKLIAEEEKQTHAKILSEYTMSTVDEEIDDLPEYEIITAAEADEEYPLTEITYYMKDKMFADETYNVVSEEDMVEYVGGDHMDYFLYGSENEIYIRNHVMEKDFAVVKDLGAYHDILEDKPYLVSNIFDTAKEE